MGKTITIAPWASPAKMTCHDYSNISGYDYDCTNISLNQTKGVIGHANFNLADLCKANSLMNKFSPFHPGTKNIKADKTLELVQDSIPHSLGEFAGYMDAADEPNNIELGPLLFHAAGSYNFNLAIDLADVDWPNDTDLGSFDYIHVWKNNTAADVSAASHIGYAQISTSSPLIINCTDTFSASSTTNTYYVWFGSTASISAGRGWRPDNNDSDVVFTYQPPSYLRRCYFDSTGSTNELIGLGTYSEDGSTDQSISAAGDTYTGTVVYWYYNTSTAGPYQLVTGNVDMYARKNDGSWTAISSLTNIAVSDPKVISSASLPFTVATNGDVIDILAIKAGETLTVGNQGYATPSEVEPTP